MEKIHTLKPYLIEAVYQWCLDNSIGTYIEIKENNNFKLFDISSNYIANLIFEEEGISFITKISKQEQQLFIGYENITKIFSKQGNHGLDFTNLEINNKKPPNLILISNNK